MNNYNKAYFFSLPLQWLFIAVIVTTIVGCTQSPANRQLTVERAFSNEVAEVKSTTVVSQYIVRRGDGSIWEVLTRDNAYGVLIWYQNCLFDPVDPVEPVVTLKLPTPPPPLEKPIL